jgi:hypothetical protein
MKIETLRRDWQKAHAGGNIWMTDKSMSLYLNGKQTGQFAVSYAQDGKLYTFHAKTVYRLAERLNMIPTGEVDYWKESADAIKAIRAGGSYTSLGGLSDTMRYLLAQEDGKDYRIVSVESKDEYDRILLTFTAILPLDTSTKYLDNN